MQSDSAPVERLQSAILSSAVVMSAIVAALMATSAGAAAKTPSNPLLGTWRFDHVQPQSDNVDQSGLQRVRGAVAAMKDIKVHFGPDKLKVVQPGGKALTYPVDYRVDTAGHTVTMIEHRKKQTIKQTYHLDADKPERMYIARRFGPVGRVHMVYKRIDQRADDKNR